LRDKHPALITRHGKKPAEQTRRPVEVHDIIDSYSSKRILSMPSLIVRNIEERVVHELKQQAARHARSAEAEHRAILESALLKTRRRSFADVLSQMPDVGRDQDFERQQDSEAADVFD
jgi:plasmid stability protein